MSHQQHTIQILTENHVNITNYSNTHGKPCKYYESQHDQLNTLPTRNPTNCAAITTRLWAGTDEHNVLQSLREGPALVNFNLDTREDVSEGWTRNDLVTWLSEKGCWMNSSWTSGLKRFNMKKTQSVRNMNKPWSWKVTQGEKLSEKQPQCESESRMETKQVALPHHFTHKNGNQQRTDTSSNTLWPTLQNDSNFTAPSMTKKHAFPDVS